jgi:uncharacterized protein YndB with AHSA1/START domain
VPIQLLADRWIDKYARPWTLQLADLKSRLEEGSMQPRHVHQVFIRTTKERLWEAIVSPELTRQYFYDTTVQSDFEPGSPVVYLSADGEPELDGAVLEISPPTRLVMSCRFLFDEEASKDPPSRITYEIEEAGPLCKLTVTHEFDGDCTSARIAESGWSYILSALKTLLETGAPLARS